ncbi:hypothetical protein ACFE04_017278 [Oxalis oulophora]
MDSELGRERPRHMHFDNQSPSFIFQDGMELLQDWNIVNASKRSGVQVQSSPIVAGVEVHENLPCWYCFTDLNVTGPILGSSSVDQGWPRYIRTYKLGLTRNNARY